MIGALPQESKIYTQQGGEYPRNKQQGAETRKQQRRKWSYNSDSSRWISGSQTEEKPGDFCASGRVLSKIHPRPGRPAFALGVCVRERAEEV